jgi:hypothetical protein
MRQCDIEKNVPELAFALFWVTTSSTELHAFITNQIAIATMATTIAPQTTGVTFFELPLRGESLGAWL